MSAKETKVLMGLDMDICRGEVFGFLGHNGAGSRYISVGYMAAVLVCPNRDPLSYSLACTVLSIIQKRHLLES
jgi:ABC-type lipopolysaccharide export system ATPase subunit